MEKNNDEINYEITPQGSLGLLAYGDIGLREWRKVKSNNFNKINKEAQKNE